MNCEIGSSPSCPSQPNDCLLSPPPLPPPTDVEHGIVEPKLEHEATDFSNHETSVTRDDSGLSQSNIQDVPSSPNQTGNKNENCEEENDESALCVICLETIGM